ncbi:MAG TPA: protein kinase [Lacunisphaera sp.]|nr:protein kinase [Lacunisphaera sp.]
MPDAPFTPSLSPIDSPEEALFAATLALPEPARAAYLEQACGDDAVLRASVEALLRAHAASTTFLPSAAGLALSAGGSVASAEEKPGDWIDRYKLLQKIGEGGCGIVYMAEQEDPVRRRVALKVIKLGMDTKEVVARFEAERQALAMMDHPNIAKVLDAGATGSGRPFFVMDLVRGVPVTKYCDTHNLATEQRLELFTQVCLAIQHAHQKGIIHRDIKPSNILVTLHDGVAVPKVIDFGIAKATQGRLTDQTYFTAFEQFIGTPAYMSPEQAEMSGLDIDTRSDIYSLGVLLYELLAGRPPFDPKTFLAAGIDEMRRFIREVDPPTPSSRLSTLAEGDQTTVAKLRGTAAAELSTALRGDLDWIVMRCLEKDRSRRYATPSELVADIQRYLANEPVTARPPSSYYRVRKFCRRHKAWVFAATAVSAALVAGLIASAGMYLRERAARTRASAAEQAEGRLRQQAETARAEEVKRAARTALDLANRNLADGHIADGLAYLVYAARKEPANQTLGPRIASVLASHNFLIPQAAPFACGSRVLALRYAQDGRTFNVGTEDGTFRVMDAATGAVKRQFQTGREVVPDGWKFARQNDMIVGARFPDNTFAVYDVATGAPKFPPLQLHPLVGLPESTRVVDLSPSGRWIYAVSGRKFWLWRADTGALQLQLNLSDIMVDCDFNPAEDTLAALLLGRTIRRWSLPSGQPIDPPHTFRAASPMPFGAAVRYSPDGRRLAIVDFLSAQIVDGATGTLLQQFSGLDSTLVPRLAAFASNDRLLVISQTQYGGWDIAGGGFNAAPLPHVLEVTYDARVRRGVAVSLDGRLRVFDVESGAALVAPAWRQGAAHCAAVSSDGTQVIMGTAAGLVHRFSLGRGAARPLVLPRSVAPPLPAPFLPELPARVLMLARDRARVIEVASGREVAGGFRYPEPVLEYPILETHPPIRPDLKFMVVRTPGRGWQSWELGPEGVGRVSLLQEAPNEDMIVTFSPTRDAVAVASMAAPRAWDLHTGTPLGPALAFPGLIAPFSLSFSPDTNRLAMGARDGSAVVFDVTTGLPQLSLKTRRQVRTLRTQYSPDGQRLLTINQDGEYRLWNSTTGEPVGPIGRVLGAAENPVFSRDGRWAAIRIPKAVTLLDGRAGIAVGESIPAGGQLVRFSPDGNRLATADEEGNAQVWAVPANQAVTEPMRHSGRVTGPEFSPDGRFLKTEESNRFNLWAVPPPLPGGQSAPEWLLALATVCASQVVDDAGQLVPATEVASRIESLRNEITTLPPDAPLADWGRWVLDDRPDRPIAPGFTITPAEADQLAAGTP